MHLRSVIVLSIVMLMLAIVGGCGGAGSVGPDADFNPGLVDPGPMDADAAIAADEAASAAKGASATFYRFFNDTVNDESWSRWTTANNGGFKSWSLYSTYNSKPKSWILGGNYWNREDDTLTSNQFLIPNVAGQGRNGIALTFYSRWSIADGDVGTVQYQYAGQGGFQTLATFTGGSNPDYPNWTKYYFKLPDTGFDTNAQIRFTFNSDTSVNGWGFGVDDVTVYQTRLNPVANFSASDGLPGFVTLTWDNNDAGSLAPLQYWIYRGSAPGGPYIPMDTVDYPGTTYNDFPLPGQTVYYVIHSVRAGYEDTVSAEDSGFALP